MQKIFLCVALFFNKKRRKKDELMMMMMMMVGVCLCDYTANAHISMLSVNHV